MEQFDILSNVLADDTRIEVYFATAYNRFGEGKPWQQGRVKQFFAQEELLIGQDFWNFICQSDEGYNTVLEAYRENAHMIRDALISIKRLYQNRHVKPLPSGMGIEVAFLVWSRVVGYPCLTFTP